MGRKGVRGDVAQVKRDENTIDDEIETRQQNPILHYLNTVPAGVSRYHITCRGLRDGEPFIMGVKFTL
jgi:hypothetical protein